MKETEQGHLPVVSSYVEDIDKILLELTEMISESSNDSLNAQQWSDPLPLNIDLQHFKHDFPLAALPQPLWEVVKEITDKTQAASNMVAFSVLSAVSCIAQRSADAEGRISDMPCSLNVLIAGKSGCRKSIVDKLTHKAIREHQDQLYQQYLQKFEAWKSATQKLKGAELTEFLASNPEPVDPTYIFTDATLDAVVMRYINKALKNGYWSIDEAAIFFNGYSMKSDMAVAGLAILTKIFEDGEVQRIRSKSNLNGSGRASDIRLSISLLGQPEILSQAFQNPAFASQGFLARGLFCHAEDLAGSRTQDMALFKSNVQHSPALQAYWQRCAELLNVDEPANRALLPMSDEAQEELLTFYNHIELAQAAGEKYQYMTPFASRAEDLARRVATVLAFYQGHDKVDRTTAHGAWQIVQYSLDEWALYLDKNVDSVDQLNNAQLLIGWLIKYCKKTEVNSIVYSKMQNCCNPKQLRYKQHLDPVVELLIDTHHIHIKSVGRQRTVVVNPALLTS